jgi:hypothetical protein
MSTSNLSRLRKERFSPLPRHWLGKEGHSPWQLAKATQFPYKSDLSWQPTTGEVTAALKIYITLVTMVDDEKQTRNVGANCLRTTYEELQLYLKLSRALIREGLKLLEATDAIERLGYKPLVYRVKGLDKNNKEGSGGHVKLPKGHLLGMRRYSSANPIMLADYPTRGVAAMNGLVIYLLLLSVVQRNDNIALISYDRVLQRTEIHGKHLRKALDLLINHDLVTVLRLNNESTFESFGLPVTDTELRGTPNAYLLKGIKGRKYNERVNTLEDLLSQRLSIQAATDFID